MEKFPLNKDKIKEAYSVMIKGEMKEIEEVKKLFNVSKLIVFSGNKRYDKLLCASCKEYLYLRCYERADKKRYCFEHLLKEEKEGASISIVLRLPILDRERILEMFNKIPVEEEEELDKRKRGRIAGTRSSSKLKNK